MSSGAHSSVLRKENLKNCDFNDEIISKHCCKTQAEEQINLPGIQSNHEQKIAARMPLSAEKEMEVLTKDLKLVRKQETQRI